MYQVFINEHRIVFVKKAKKNKEYFSTFYIFQPVENDFMTIVKWLFIEKVAMEVQFIVAEPKKQWELFQQQFNYLAAAGGIVNNAKNELLFIKRNGKWDLPKGKAEKGEEVAEAAKREVEEECGVNALEIIKKLPSTFHLYEHQEEIIIKETFWFRMKTDFKGTLKAQVEERITEVCWVDPNQMQMQLENTYASLVEMMEDV